MTSFLLRLPLLLLKVLIRLSYDGPLIYTDSKPKIFAIKRFVCY